jgi:hypothetical protein
MSAEELKEFLAAMELVRQANAAFADVAHNFLGQDVGQDDDLDQDGSIAGLSKSVTLH